MKKKINFKNILLTLAIVLFIVITIGIITNKIIFLDNKIQDYILNIRHDNLTTIMLILTNICNTITLIIITIIILFKFKKKKEIKYIFYNLINIGIISQVLKFVFRRPRPIGINLINESGYSYPSGHSMAVMAYFGFIIYLLCKNANKKGNKYLLNIGLIVLTLLICITRIYLGVHYPTDTLGGVCIAIIYLIIFTTIYDKKEGK